MTTDTNKFREQIADLILKDPEGNQLVVVSTLDKNNDGSMAFTVGEDKPDGERPSEC